MVSNILTIFLFFTTIFTLLDQIPREKRPKALRKLKLSNVLLVLAFLVLGFELYNNYVEADEKETSTENLDTVKRNVVNLNTKAEIEFENLNSKLEDLNELADDIDDIAESTREAIAEREESLKEYNRISEELRQKVLTENRILTGKKPRVAALSSESKIETEDSIRYQYKIFLKNFGDRVAVDVEYEMFTLILSEGGGITHQFRTNYLDPDVLTLYPHSVNKTFHFVNAVTLDSMALDSATHLLTRINVEWLDEFTNKRDHHSMSFSTVKGNDQFGQTGTMSGHLQKVIDSYLKDKDNPFIILDD